MQQPQPSGRPVPSADRCGPALRCCPHRVRVLPASAADDRELPAVPPAQGLALRRPLHELHQGGESHALPGMPPVAGEEQRESWSAQVWQSERSGFCYTQTPAGRFTSPSLSFPSLTGDWEAWESKESFLNSVLAAVTLDAGSVAPIYRQIHSIQALGASALQLAEWLGGITTSPILSSRLLRRQ